MSEAKNTLRIFDEAVQVLKAEPIADKKITKEFEEWKELKQQLEVLNTLAKKIGGRVSEIEGSLMAVTKQSVGQQVIIDRAIVNIKSRKTSGTKWTAVISKALEIMNESQRTVLKEFQASVTTKGVKETLNIVDPDLAVYVEQIENMSQKDLMKQMSKLKSIPDKIAKPKKTAKASAETSEGVMDSLKALAKKVLAGFKGLMGALQKSDKAADALLKASES